MSDERRYSVRKCKDAVSCLREAADTAKTQLEKDGLIQRFEFSVELAWKTLKRHLHYEGMVCRSPRECFEAAFRLGWLPDEEPFIQMLMDLNRTSHIYDQQTSDQIVEHIRVKHTPALEDLVEIMIQRTGE